jgi:hypothetical protein
MKNMTHTTARSKKKGEVGKTKKKKSCLGMRRNFSGATEKIAYVA